VKEKFVVKGEIIMKEFEKENFSIPKLSYKFNYDILKHQPERLNPETPKGDAIV
jgi:hypothetical protein